jgi:hypothetical protein
LNQAQKQETVKNSQLSESEWLVTLSLGFFSLLAVIVYFLRHSQAIYFLPLSLLLILVFLNLPGWRQKYQTRPEPGFLVIGYTVSRLCLSL